MYKMENNVKVEITEDELEVIIEQYFEESDDFVEKVKEFCDNSDEFDISEAEEIVQTELEEKFYSDLEEKGEATIGDIKIIA